MAGSRMPIATAHGEGCAAFAAARRRRRRRWSRCASSTTAARRPKPIRPIRTARPRGITGLTTADGRFTILMPHPERVFRTVQKSWHPQGWGEDGPWMRMFRNARAWVG